MTTGKDDNDGKEDYDEDFSGYRWRGSQTTINQKRQKKKWQGDDDNGRGRQRQWSRTTTMARTMTVRTTENDGKDDR